MKQQTIFVVLLIVLVLGGGFWWVLHPTTSIAPISPLDTSTSTTTSNIVTVATFAQCIKNSGATFYGAFWCSHCQEQKALFGSAVKLLPYVECSKPDGKSLTQVCIDQKITVYPTWKFVDGSELTGKQTFADLVTRTGCTAPTQSTN